ncbi:hypothetical protein [Nocardia sp. CDC160]|uniref:hypothetical protein n=1 Tax=Nocardia sp. CDC160 TaxID=3112166 RepID=UPI002DBC1837|nr:hypothetical protein [Nocardia sp. CDC160]MEC3915495.1 hypothetical protein [Nocardia sp. CDC160]
MTLTAYIGARTETRRPAAIERQQTRQDLIQRDNQVRELQIEHLRWRREHRQAAYLDLIEAANTADRANQQYFRELLASTEPIPADQARLAEIRQHFKHAEHISYKVMLEGPAEVAQAAQRLIDALATVIHEVREIAQTPASQTRPVAAAAAESAGWTYLDQQKEFLGTARAALDEISSLA